MARVPAGFTIEPGTGRLVRITSRQCTVTQFMRRLSLAEYVALNALILNPSGDLETRAKLETLKQIRDNTQNKMVDLDDPQTVLGAGVALSALAELPEGTPGRVVADDVPARVSAWLADFPQPGEVE